jgi:hypothetical protein
VPRVRHAHAQVLEPGDVGPDHRRAAGVDLLAHPPPALLRVVGLAHVQVQAEVRGDVALEVGGPPHEVQRRDHLRQLEVQEAQPAAEPEDGALGQRPVAVVQAVVLEQVAQRAGAAVAGPPVREGPVERRPERHRPDGTTWARGEAARRGD